MKYLALKLAVLGTLLIAYSAYGFAGNGETAGGPVCISGNGAAQCYCDEGQLCTATDTTCICYYGAPSIR